MNKNLRTFILILTLFLNFCCRPNIKNEDVIELSIRPTSGGTDFYRIRISKGQLIYTSVNQPIKIALLNYQKDSLNLLLRKNIVLERNANEGNLLALDSWEYTLKVNDKIIDRFQLNSINSEPLCVRQLIEYILKLAPEKIILRGFS